MRLTRAQQSAFAEYQKLAAIRNYITENATDFTAGNEVHTDAIFQAFELAEPTYAGMTPQETIKTYNKWVSKRTTLTKRFNRILAERGMYIKKKHNANYWCIKTNDRVEAKIERLYATSQNNQYEGMTLERGYEAHKNNYGRVSNTTLKRIAARTRRR